MHYVQRPEEGSTFSGTEVKRRLLAATWMLGIEYKPLEVQPVLVTPESPTQHELLLFNHAIAISFLNHTPIRLTNSSYYPLRF